MISLERHLEINSQNFLVIIKLLRSAGASARIVGGAVRDALLNLPCSDIDIATDMLPDEVIVLLQKNRIKVMPTGIKFGTVTALIKDESFEITTLRADIDCDGRHADVIYSKDFAEDAARRDFTINALSYCPLKGVVYDYFGGIKDLEARKVIFIGQADQRIKEDYLRILRFFRFSCRYSAKIDQEGLKACAAYKEGLQNLSFERIKSEMDLLLTLNGSPNILFCMSEEGILAQILPVNDYDVNLHLKALEMSDKFKAKIDACIVYAILFNNTKLSYGQLLSLKFSRTEAKNIIKMLALKEIKDINELIVELKNIWLDEVQSLLYFIYASLIVSNPKLVYDLHTELSSLKIPICPVDGNHLLALGYRGKEVGYSLNLIKKAWIESNFSLDHGALIDLVKNNEK
ncbi:MAG: CCA tRNA nucleotidyltransferase [Rickettsiaceae bacterium]|nr:CCA tRNA nucleotidyltransferase [Rickettsiaceae bacterium]